MATGFVVLTAVGPDRVGIVDDIAGAVSGAGCNIEESKMAVLGGEFAVIMLVSGPAASVRGRLGAPCRRSETGWGSAWPARRRTSRARGRRAAPTS